MHPLMLWPTYITTNLDMRTKMRHADCRASTPRWASRPTKKNYAHLNRISNHQLKMATSKFVDFMNSKNPNFKAFIADAKEVMTVLSFWLIIDKH